MTVQQLECPIGECPATFTLSSGLRDHLKQRHFYSDQAIGEALIAAGPKPPAVKPPAARNVSVESHDCLVAGCGRTGFKSAQAVAVHRARAHGVAGATKKTGPRTKPVEAHDRPPTPTPPQPVELAAASEPVVYEFSCDAATAERFEAWCWLHRTDVGAQIEDLIATLLTGDHDDTIDLLVSARRTVSA